MADRDILKRIIERLREMEPLFTEDVALQIEQQIRQEYAGERIYIQKRDPDRREKLLKRFNGHNINDMAGQFGIHRVTVYRSLRRR